MRKIPRQHQARLRASGLCLVALAFALPASRPSTEGAEQFEVHEVRGWTVSAYSGLRINEGERLDRSLDLLQCKLADVERAVPPSALAFLKTVHIWLDPRDQHHPCAVYHPAKEWLVAHGYDPAKADCVHITNLHRFLEWSRQQPDMLLHELSHAYHDQKLGFDHPLIREAFERARESGDYDSVLHSSGRNTQHYALTSPQEFFAELSESYFGTNDFYPFVRAELKVHDPESYALIQSLWGVE